MKYTAYFDSGFEDADNYNDTQDLITSLEVQQANTTLTQIRDQVYHNLVINKNENMLEIGCGLGTNTYAMAQILQGGIGKAVGLDKSTVLLSEARKRYAGHAKNLEYREGDVINLCLESESFSFVYAERVLMHVSNVNKAISEMARVLKKGGRITITEPDLNSVMIYPNDNNISRLLVDKWCEYTQSPGVGGELLQYYTQNGLSSIEISAKVLCVYDLAELNRIRNIDKLLVALVGESVITEKEAKQYKHTLVKASQDGCFLFYSPVFTVSATKEI